MGATRRRFSRRRSRVRSIWIKRHFVTHPKHSPYNSSGNTNSYESSHKDMSLPKTFHSGIKKGVYLTVELLSRRTDISQGSRNALNVVS